MEEERARYEVADNAFKTYLQERENHYYLADSAPWNTNEHRWTRTYWLGSRTSMHASERTFFIDFVPGTAEIERQWQE